VRHNYIRQSPELNDLGWESIYVIELIVNLAFSSLTLSTCKLIPTWLHQKAITQKTIK